MAESALIPAANGILNGLLSLANDHINNQINMACGFKKDLEKLRERLTIIQALLQDAENRKITSQTMMVWLKKFQAATCDAENVLDELAYEDLRRKIEVQNRMRDKVHNFFSTSNPLLFHFKMANKVSDINKLLDRICKAAIDVGLQPAKQLNDAIGEPGGFRKTLPFIGDIEVVGRDGDVKRVVDMLLGSNIGGDLQVIAIVGMPGVGKTTLAQVVYKDANVLNNFSQERMWICASDDFKVERLLNEMMQSLTGNKSDTPNIEGVVRKLGEKLKGKKYLLVLDDVWNKEPNLWVDLRNCLIGIGGSKESKILVTTRSMDVVLAMRTSPSCTHQLTTLSDADCLAMFRKRAFAYGGPRETPTLVDIGRRMVKKCKGVPLAINVLGGLLYSKHDVREWESIEKSEIWSLLEQESGILPALRLSFDLLPSPSLKQCFSYCSIFPKDQVIEKDELIQLWMALGYLQPFSRSKEEMEELGNEYFNILWRNSLFQEVKFDEYNNMTTCKMHDLVHDLAVDVSQGNCCTLKDGEVKINPDVQHLSFLGGKTCLDISNENVGKLRTLLLKGDLPESTKDLKCVRALRLVKSELSTFKCCKSIHLRFLDISESSIMKVPNFITKFYNLETLKLSRRTSELPKDFHNLVSLRHFYLEDTCENRNLMPLNIGKLTSLRTLPFFAVGKDSGHRIEELGSLSKLRGRLKVYDLQHVKDKEEAKTAKMSEKSNIQEFQFYWDGGLGESDNNHEDVLDGLEPHRNVNGLVLVNFRGRRLASWMSTEVRSLQNLIKIELMYCKLCDQVPPLGHLPHLVFIKMIRFDNLKRIGLEFYGLNEGIMGNCSSSGAGAGPAGGVFPALRKFILYDMPELKEWSDISSLPDVATSTMQLFPCLQELDIRNCPMLITIPDAACKGSTSLTELYILECLELTCLPEGLLQPTLVVMVLRTCPKLKTSNPDALRRLTSLEHLVIKSCPKLGSCWEEGLICTTSLQSLFIGLFGEEYRYFPWPSTSRPWSHFTSLHLFGWEEVKSLPDQLENLTALRQLSIHNFSGLETLPEFLGNLSSLQSLHICGNPVISKRCDKDSGEDWHKIAHIPEIYTEAEFNGLMSLQNLHSDKCPEWTSLPENCPKLKTPIPDALRSLTSLKMLAITGCPKLGSGWEEGLIRTTSLQYLSIGWFGEEYRYFPWWSTSPPWSHFTSLETIHLYGWEEVKSLPDQLEYLPAWRHLGIWHFSGLESLPEWLVNLSSLESLQTWECPLLLEAR